MVFFFLNIFRLFLSILAVKVLIKRFTGGTSSPEVYKAKCVKNLFYTPFLKEMFFFFFFDNY